MLTDQIVDDLTAKMIEDVIDPMKRTAQLFKGDEREVELYVRGAAILLAVAMSAARDGRGLSAEQAAVEVAKSLQIAAREIVEKDLGKSAFSGARK